MGSATNPMAPSRVASEKVTRHQEDGGASDVELSEDDVSFFTKNPRFASFLASER